MEFRGKLIGITVEGANDMAGIRITDLVVDCADAKTTSGFYSKLLGWDIGEAFGMPTVTSPDGAYTFLFAQEEDYVPPVWPEVDGKQQKQLHLDFVVDDYEGTIEKAVRLGAKRAETQYMPDHFTVLLDPAGHPFCLCKG
jgi:catechol 2,3-dioxygenase-like lactoylglutathione lyase family enzyme